MMLDRVRLDASAKLNRQLKVELNTSNSHTQVNATDLRLMKYPSRGTLISLGRWASRQGELSQEKIENRIRELGMVSP